METLDLKLKLLSNSPITIDGVNVYPVSIKQIAEFGYTKYNEGIKILCISREKIGNWINEEISPFEFLEMNMVFDPNIKTLLCETLSLICRAKVIYSSKLEGFIIGKEILNKTNFETITNIICMRNSLDSSPETDEKPSNEKAKMILQKRRNARNKLIKNKYNERNLYLHDMVSIVSVGMHLPISRVTEYSVYQLLDQFNRLMAKENYETTILSLIHGASKNDLDLKHWTQN